MSKLIVFVMFGLISATSFASVSLPDVPQNYVTDLAGIINDDAETRLNAYLKELEQKTTAQMIVLTIQSLEGEPIEDFSLKVAHDKWKLGQKGKDNGVLLLIALEDRRYRLEVGYGLEGILPDSLAGSIGREHLVPNFRKGDYSGGIFNAALAVINEIALHEGVQITGMPKAVKRLRGQGRRRIGVFDTIAGIAFFIILAILFIKHPRLLLLLLLTSSHGRRGGWSGGGFGGGGFGGFGGGGGGGFGGGGASGRW
ncbi:MAG: TPM domain-containing protein [Nitrospirae bacterium]|nr:TPM domain-containing protein [Nitrospirota bacterium]